MPVYFIQAGDEGPVKIGWAVSAEKRRTDLQIGNHMPLTLLRQIDGAYQVERWLHGHYADRLVRGEWFHFCPTMLTIQPPEIEEPEGRAMSPEVQKAAKIVGGIKPLCERLGLTRSALYQWEKVPRGRAVEIEFITGGKVARHQMRPDLWPQAEREDA